MGADRMRALLVGILASSVAPSFAEEVCTLKRVAQIPFETDETAHIYIPATVGGQPTRLVLDTGAYWSAIHEDLARTLDLKFRTARNFWLVDLAGEKMDQYVTIDEMTLGQIVYGLPVDFFIERSASASSIENRGGTLGINFIARMDLEIDNAGKTVSLFSQDHCKGAGVYWTNEAVVLQFNRQERDIPTGTRIRTQRDYEPINMPVVGAELEGEPVRALLDTGSTVTLIALDHAKRRFGIEPGSPGVQPAGVAHLPSGATVNLYSYTFESLTISGIRFENIPVHLGEFEETELILGMHELKHLRLYFVFQDGMIHITAADAGR